MSDKKRLLIQSTSVTSSLEHPLPLNIPVTPRITSGTPSSTSPFVPPEKDFSNLNLNLNPISNIEESSKDLKTLFEKVNCNENFYSKDCNQFLLKKELLEHDYLKNHPKEDNYLYPNLNDPNFIIKIAEKKEFHDTQYDGEIHDDIKTYADTLSKAEFELAPHQAFVRNFLSFQTPYNSLLLYHGLGSGKTCSAIGVCEEMRNYLKQVSISKRIIIVASKNVQDNFRLQLFDERKLKNIDGIWNIKGCIGNKLLKEINPIGFNGLTREKIISQIKGLINNSYLFLGYGQFANYIIKTATVEPGSYSSESVRIKKAIRQLKAEFDSRLIVIDEVHNIRMTEDNENKYVAMNLELLVKSAENIRLLLLSATPMYNSYKEIVWLINIMNINDRRGKVMESSIFDKKGNFKADGQEIFIRKATGYVSFVRGENPYTFPYRIYPSEFDIQHTFKVMKRPFIQMNGKRIEESEQSKILDLYLVNIGETQSYGYKYILDYLKTKTTNVTTKKGSTRIMPTFEEMESFGYTLLQKPLEALIIVYPYDGLKELLEERNNVNDEIVLKEDVLLKDDNNDLSVSNVNFDIKPEILISNKDEEDEKDESGSEFDSLSSNNNDNNNSIRLTSKPSSELSISSYKNIGGAKDRTFFIDPNDLTGKEGLKRIMNFTDEKNPPLKGSFEYKSKQYGRIFSLNEIGKYSSKIKNILNSIVSPEGEGEGKVSEGIILIYSQYIDGGLIPVALALEEMGFIRYGENGKNLFKDKPVPTVDVRTMKPKTGKNSNFIPARYSMITGDIRLSPNNDFEVKGLTSQDNVDGNKVKVVLISKAGSEGIDLKFIRQVHILDPWYNMNRVEQTIGRAVRNFSHKDLPFEKRNVEIFMYATILQEKETESADVYVYRVAEFKAVQIGKVSRVLKETAVDCIINHDQTNFTREIMDSILKEPITQILSNGIVLNNFKIGDAPFSPACDYMETCEYQCRPNAKVDELTINEDTYNEEFIMVNTDKIIQKIKLLMKESFFYKKKTLLELIDVPKVYPLVQKYAALTQLIEDSNEFITDKYDRTGHLINIGEYYLFQPLELNFKNVSIYDRSVPIDYKHDMIKFEMKENALNKSKIEEEFVEKEEKDFSDVQAILDNLRENYDLVLRYQTEDLSIKRGDDNWYKFCGVTMKRLINGGMNKVLLDDIIIDHLLDSLFYKEKVDVLNYVYSTTSNIQEGTLEEKVMNYFRRNAVTFQNTYQSGTTTTILLYNNDAKEEILIFDNNSQKWKKAEPEDKREILESVKVREKWIIKTESLSNLVGFMGYEKQNRYLSFKIKDMKSKRNSGARCDEGGKVKTMKMLNEVIGEERYTSETTKGFVQLELCCLLELIMRYYTKTKVNNKIWFLNSDIALFNKF